MEENRVRDRQKYNYRWKENGAKQREGKVSGQSAEMEQMAFEVRTLALRTQKKCETKNENKITFKDMYKFSLLCISFHKQVNNTPWLGNVMQRCVIFTDCIKSTHNGKEVFVLSPYSLQNNHFRSICGSVLASRADELILAWSNVIPALHEAKHKFRIFLKHKLQYKSCSIYDTESRSYWNLQL